MTCVRTPQPSCSADGQHARTRACSIRKGDTWDRMLQQGIQLLDRASARTTASSFASRDQTCRSSLRGRSRKRTPSWPMSMRSENWMARAACWSGRRPQGPFRRNPRGYWLWIRNSSATPDDRIAPEAASAACPQSQRRFAGPCDDSVASRRSRGGCPAAIAFLR
jgi:hypothetical protein